MKWPSLHEAIGIAFQQNLELTKGNVTQAAKIFNVSVTTAFKMITEYSIDIKAIKNRSIFIIKHQFNRDAE